MALNQTDEPRPASRFNPLNALLPGGHGQPRNEAGSFYRNPQMLWLVGLTALLVLGYSLPVQNFFSSPAHYVPIHTALELLSIAISLMVAALAWNVRKQQNNNRSILLGAGFSAVCLIDLGHTLSYVGMPDFITPNSVNKAIYFWLSARYIAALSILAIVILPARRWPQPVCAGVYGGALTLAAGVFAIVLSSLDDLPLMHISAQGLTALKIGAEHGVTSIYALAAATLLLQGHRQRNADDLWLATGAWTLALSEQFFTRYSDVTDLSNLLGHVYKAIAYMMIYRALYVSGVQAPYRELAFERSWLRSLLGAIPDPVWLKNSDGKYLSCNTAFEQRFGVTQADILGKSDYDIFSRAEADLFRANDHLAMSKVTPNINSEWIRLANGQECLFETTKAVPRFADGAAIGVLGIAHDITEQKRIEDELRLAATTFESQEGIFITDANEIILRVNHAFTKITGYSAEEAIGKTPKMLQSGRHDEAFYAALKQHLAKHGSWHGEIWNRRKDEEIYPEWLTITAVHDSDGALTHYVANIIDISERKAASERIKYLSLYDSLTQLPNRKLLFDRLSQAIRNCARHRRAGALLMIDLNNFKMLNETEGHQAGDQLLAEVAARLMERVRNNDTVARIGGDEFAIILEDLDLDGAGATQAEMHARDILLHLARPYRLQLAHKRIYHYQCSSSVGIVLFATDTDSAEQLFKRADTAMYRAKAKGHDELCFFDPQMQATVEAHAALEADLRRALSAQQLLLHYQPQVDSAGTIIGAEALVRWQHPQRGMVSPGSFIPLAEETGLIIAIGEWVLLSACEQLARWARQPTSAQLTLAVNISARQIAQPDFVAQVESILQQTGAPADKLKLELTESLLAQNTDDIIGKMYALKTRGVRFSLDDFGTGYSSLSYLKRLPLSQLKIDQSFVRDIATDPNDAAIAKTVIALGETLGLAVIAEGVETQTQRDHLSASGCRLFQGYLFSKPLPLREFEQRVHFHQTIPAGVD